MQFKIRDVTLSFESESLYRTFITPRYIYRAADPLHPRLEGCAFFRQSYFRTLDEVEFNDPRMEKIALV